VLCKKIESYDLDYKNACGDPHPVKLVSYIWKRVDGFILDFLKKELMESNPHACLIKPKTKSQTKIKPSGLRRKRVGLGLTTNNILPKGGYMKTLADVKKVQSMLADSLWNIDRLATYLSVPKGTVRYWVYERSIPYVKAGRHVRFRHEDIERWLESHRVEQQRSC
jgi:excisionase family DNA binding protein